MNTAQHTPGPWIYGVREDGSMWLSIGDHNTGPHYQGDLCASQADARLISAAPELLAALIALDEAFCNTNEFSTREERHAGRIALIAARAAIAKATGSKS